MGIDPRGARFAAVVSTIVLALVLITGSGWLLAAQTLVFAVGAALGLRFAPYGMVFRWLIRPRLGPPAELEAEPPPRFAQGIGAVFGVIWYGTVVTVLGMAATAAALAAAFLNAAFGFCLGCEMYLMIQRIRTGGREGAVHRT